MPSVTSGDSGLGHCPLLLVFLPDVFTNDVWVCQVETRRLEDEASAPDGEEPTNPSEDQPRINVSVVLVCEWWARVREGRLKSPKITVGSGD